MAIVTTTSDNELADAYDAPFAFVRLEPETVSGDPVAGVVAALHDPLWSLLRQWQFAEFIGTDGGWPLRTVVGHTSAPLDRWKAGMTGPGNTWPCHYRPACRSNHWWKAEESPECHRHAPAPKPGAR